MPPKLRGCRNGFNENTAIILSSVTTRPDSPHGWPKGTRKTSSDRLVVALAPGALSDGTEEVGRRANKDTVSGAFPGLLHRG